MPTIETTRLTIRPFQPTDAVDVHELAVDWKSAPGPEFDKWPTEPEACRGLAEHFAGKPERFLAIALKASGKVIGLLGLNGFEENGQFDLGHVILSQYQDDDTDREALSAIVDHLFARDDVNDIVTRNANAPRQLAPLKSIGFTNENPGQEGILALSRQRWTDLRGL